MRSSVRATDPQVSAAWPSRSRFRSVRPPRTPSRPSSTERVKELRVGHSLDATRGLRPARVHKDAVDRVSNFIQIGSRPGSELLADGRGFTVEGYENGFFLGPTLFDRVTPT